MLNLTGRWERNSATILSAMAKEWSGAAAVFDADGTLWLDDIGEAFLEQLDQRQELVAFDYERPALEKYQELCRENTTTGYAWCAQVLAGLREERVDELAADFYAGFRSNIIPEMQQLVRELVRCGVETWIVSASNQWLVRQAAEDFDLPRERILAIHTEVVDGIVTDRLVHPITNARGKVEAIERYLGRRPVLAAGNSINDYEMLALSQGVRLMINPTPELTHRAPTDTNWLTQHFGDSG